MFSGVITNFKYPNCQRYVLTVMTRVFGSFCLKKMGHPTLSKMGQKMGKKMGHPTLPKIKICWVI